MSDLTPSAVGRRLLAVICLCACALLALSVRAEDADTLYREGSKALQDGDAATAYTKLSQAFKLKQSVDIAGNLAMAELKLGKNRDAASHLDHALRTYPATGDAARKERIRGLLADTKKSVAEISIAVDEGATVKVDGVAVGLAPLAAPIFVEPGKHQLEATRGSSRADRALDVNAGATQTVVLVLVDTGAATASASSTPSALPSSTASGTPSARPAERPAWPAVVMGSVAAVGIGVGVGSTVAGVGATGEVDGTPCPGLEETCDMTVADAVSQRNLLVGVGAVGFSVGAAALTGMVLYLVWPEATTASEAAGLHIEPAFGPSSAALSIGGRF